MNEKQKILTSLGLAAGTVAAASLGGITVSAMSVQTIAASAVPVANANDLYPSVMIAQAILESSAGSSQLASQYNNYFGVKYTSGEGVDLPTTEYINGVPKTIVQKFQVYSSATASFQAQAALLRTSFYSGSWRSNTSSYQEATAALQGRYATNPNYAHLLNEIIAEYDLTAYDTSSYTSPATSTSSDAPKTYIVQTGDTLSVIAANYGTTSSDLASLNGISNANKIVVGQVLRLPDASSSQSNANASASGIYTVVSGDSLWSIAQAYGTTAAQLATINGISQDSLLQIGQTLRLSADVASPAIGVTYTVKPGDTLSSIAQAYGTTVDQIVALNGLTNSNLLAVGQTLDL